MKSIRFSATILLTMSLSTAHVFADTGTNWRGNSFYKTDENRYERAKTPSEVEEEQNASKPKRSLTDIFKNIELALKQSSGLNDVSSTVGSSVTGIAIGNNSTELINKGDGYFYSGSQKIISFTGESRPEFSQAEFIDYIAPIAMELGIKYSVFPSVIIANAAEESGWGNSALVRDCNNIGGVKAYNTWEGPLSTSSSPSNEDAAYYRGYASINASIEDKCMVLQNSRYDTIREAKTPYEALRFHITGYAGNPSKDENLASIIKANNLTQYDVSYNVMLSKGQIKHTPKTREDIRANNFLN